MTSFKDMWNTAAQQEKKTFGDLPEGTYKGEVKVCRFQPSKDGTKENLFWDLQVVEGEEKGSHIYVYRPFSKTDTSDDNQKAINRALNDFIQLELPCNAEAIEKTMINVVGKTVEIVLKNATNGNGQFKNFKKIIEIENTPTESFGETEISDKELPF